jgi:hypothetical protein
MIVASSPQHDGKEPLGELSARDADILTFERQWWDSPGQEQAIRDIPDVGYALLGSQRIDRRRGARSGSLLVAASVACDQGSATAQPNGSVSHDHEFQLSQHQRMPSPIGLWM